MTENTQTAFEAHEVSEEGRGNVAVGSPDEPLTTTQNPSDGAIVPIVPDEAKAPSRTGSQTSRLSRHSGDSTTSRQSVHVQIPEGVKPGEKFYVVVDNLEYEVWAPQDSSPGEMVAMEVFSNLAESQAALTASRESARSGRSHTKNSEAESVATDGSLVYVQIPEGCVPGETFFTEVNGFEYEILVPSNCESGDLIYLEVPAKHAISKFVVPENSEAPVITDILNEEPSSDGHLADVCVPAGVRAGQTFVVIIEGVEFEVPVPEGYGPGDLLSLQMPSKGMQTTSVASSAIAGLEEVRAELEQVRAELREVKEQHLRETLRREQEGRFVNESKSSGDSNFIQIQIPLDCYEGDAFVVEVDDAEFQMVVPLGCSPGEVIYMDMREGAGYPIENPTTQQKNTSRPASGVRKVAKDILPEEDVHETDSAVAISSISEPQETLEIVIPEDCYEGDIFVIEVKGVELELTVPDGCQPGELIYVDVPREGSSVVTSRPASANQKLSHENVAKQEREQLERKQQEEAARMQEEAAAATIQDIKEEDATSSSQEAMEIIIPQDCYPGDIFVIEVKGVELELTVPDGCQPGELIYVDVPREGSTVVTSRPASAEQQKQFAAKQQELARQAEEEAAQAAEAAKKEKDREEAQRWRADSKKQQAINKAEREAQEEEARIKREEDEKRGKDVMSVFSGQVQALLADAVGETFKKSEREETRENQAPVSEGGHVAAGHPGTKSSLTESQSVMSVPHSKSQTGYAEPAEAAEATDRATEEAAEEQTQQTQQTVSGESGESGEKAGKAETVETGAETLETTQEVDAKEEGKAMTSVASVAVAVASRSPSVTSRHSSRHSSHSSYSIHVQVPDGVYPGDRFLVMVDDREYEVIAPSGSAPGEMVAMDICSDIDGDPRISLTVSKESKDSKHPQGSPGLQASQVGTAQSQDARVSENVDKGDKAKKNTDPRSTTNVSTASDAVSGSDSVAADAILVPVEIPDGCSEGETFFAEVNGVEYEILVPNGCTSGHLIYLEIPGKHAIGKFVTPETADSLPAQVPEVSVKDMVSVDSPGEDSLFAEVTVPDGAQEGQNFIAIIDGTEFEVPVPEGFQAGDALSLQLPPSGLQADPTSSALQEVWAEIAKVREELKRVQEDRVRLREEDLRLGPGGSKSSADSNIVEILIPPDCHAGDSFIVEVDDAEFEMVVPDGCGPGERIYMDMLEGAGHTPENLTKKQKRSSRSASGVRKVQKEHEGPRHEVVEITIPEDCYAGDVFTVEVKGKELEMTVPDGCQPGDALLMDLLPEGTLTNSRPASAKKETITESVAEQGTAGQEAARKEHPSGQEGGKQDGAARQEEISALKEQAERSEVAEAEAEAEAAVAQEAAAKAEVHAETEEVTVLEVVEAYRLAVSILSGSDLIAEADASCACRIKGQEEAEFQTASLGDRVNPQWNHEHVMEEFTPGQVLQFELTETMGGSQFVIGTVELVWEDFSEGLNESKSLTGTDGLIHIKIENLGTVAEHVAKLDAERLEAERIEAERLEAERLEKERQEAERLAEEAAAEMARKEAEERERMAEAERQSREVEEAIAAEEAERQRQEALRQQAIEEEERRKREEEEREAAKEAAKKAKEEAERQRLELLKQQQLEEAERAIREEEARIKREEAERKGKIVISVTVLNDETEEVMAKASLRLGCKVLELGQVCVREARLSVAPAIYSEPKPEPKLVRGKMEYRERFALPPEDTLLEAGVENNAVLRAKISSAVITASKDCTARVWNAETGSCELVLEGHNEAVCSACISPDCRYVATSSEDSSARLWYVDSGRCARVLQDHKEAVYSASFSPDSKQVVTASEDGTAKIWVVKTGLCKLTLKGHNFAVLWAAFSPDGRSVTTTSSDGTLKIWNAKTGVCDRTLLGQKPVYLASFATDGTTFVTASGDATAKICDLMTGESKIVLSGHDNLVLGASYAPSCPQAEQQTEQQKDENG